MNFSYAQNNKPVIIIPHRFTGLVRVPASKSHTIRQLFIATLADGVSEIEAPLDSIDTRSSLSVCRVLGAEIMEFEHAEAPGRQGWRVVSKLPESLRIFASSREVKNETSFSAKRCDVGNSDTALFFGLAVAALGAEPVEFDGDEQIRRRSAEAFLEALSGLGISVKSAASGRPPITVCGPWKGGRVSLPCPTSQYLSALLLAAPMAPAGVITEIDVPLLNEKPYIEMTLAYLDEQGIPYEAASDFSYFRIPGGSTWKAFSGPVPGDFSFAAFPAAAAAITGGPVRLLGLDPHDTQGDKVFFNFLKKRGCQIRAELVSLDQVPGSKIHLGDPIHDDLQAIGVPQAELHFAEWQISISRNGHLKGGVFDLNDTPDLLPAMAAVACFARGDTALVNAAHARLKETDRIRVMAEELKKLGFAISENPDGLVIHGSGGKLARKPEGSPVRLDSRGDHRVAMALACAALGGKSAVEIAGAGCAEISYPHFFELLGA